MPTIIKAAAPGVANAMISIVICSIDPRKFAAIERHYASVMGAEPFEIVGIHDATSMGQGYNLGLSRSRGEIVAFSHDDIEFLGPSVPERLKRHLDEIDVVGLAGTDRLVGPSWVAAGPPHLFGQVAHRIENGYGVCIYGVHRRLAVGMQAMDGLFLAFRRPAIEAVGWDASTFDGFHLYDLDSTFRAHLRGFRLGVASDLPVLHASGGRRDESLERLARAFMRKHGDALGKPQPYWHQFAAIHVRTKQEALDVMTPAYLNEI